MHAAPMQCFQNALAYFATVLNYKGKMSMKLTPVDYFINILQM